VVELVLFPIVATIKSYAKPTELYRYRSLKKCDRELDAIEQKSLYCSSFIKLNDPMEGMFRSHPRLRLHDNYREVIDSILRDKSNTGICSFSEIKDSAPMWAHYAHGFTGICIAYNLSRLLEAVEQDATFVQVLYKETVPIVSQSGPEECKMILSYKNYGWRYEREWRMFGSLGQVPYPNECVTRVYLGSQMTDENRNLVTSRLRRLNIDTQDITIDGYSIDFGPTSER
jgi:Protein of unknown function (DUF2971)